MDPGEYRDRIAPVHLDRGRPHVVEAHVQVTRGHSSRLLGNGHIHVRDLGEALGSEQLLGHVLRCDADAFTPVEPDPRVSGGGSASATPEWRATSPAAPATAAPRRNSRRSHQFATLFILLLPPGHGSPESDLTQA